MKINFNITIETDNDSFQNGNFKDEVNNCLGFAVERMMDNINYNNTVKEERRNLMDSNGNPVGLWEIKTYEI